MTKTEYKLDCIYHYQKGELDMSDIYSLIASYDVNRSKRHNPGDEFKEHRHTIRALKIIGWAYRDVIHMMYSSMLSDVPESMRIDNNQLMRKMSYWKKNHLLSDVEVNREVEKLKSSLNLDGRNFSKIDFLKSIEKTVNRELVGSEKMTALKHYTDNKDMSIEQLISSFVVEKLETQ